MNLITVGDIAKKLDIDRDAVAYAIRKENIEPVGRAGLVRLFPDTALDTVRYFIKRKKSNVNK
jgi:hypothetical protein